MERTCKPFHSVYWRFQIQKHWCLDVFCVCRSERRSWSFRLRSSGFGRTTRGSRRSLRTRRPSWRSSPSGCSTPSTWTESTAGAAAPSSSCIRDQHEHQSTLQHLFCRAFLEASQKHGTIRNHQSFSNPLIMFNKRINSTSLPSPSEVSQSQSAGVSGSVACITATLLLLSRKNLTSLFFFFFFLSPALRAMFVKFRWVTVLCGVGVCGFFSFFFFPLFSGGVNLQRSSTIKKWKEGRKPHVFMINDLMKYRLILTAPPPTPKSA